MQETPGTPEGHDARIRPGSRPAPRFLDHPQRPGESREIRRIPRPWRDDHDPTCGGASCQRRHPNDLKGLTMKTNQMTYRQAMAELTGIVNRLRDSENVDVDELVTDVARSKELIQFCDGKIKKADAAIKGIVS